MNEMKAAHERRDFETYRSLLLRAWDLIPQPKIAHDRAQEVLGGIVHHYRDTGRAEEALNWLPILRDAYGGGANPYVDFLSATVLMETGREEEAFHLFDRLHAEYGKRPFQGKDPKYRRFYEERKSKRR